MDTPSEALADWTWRLLVNRTDVYGGYLPLSVRTVTKKSVTRPSVADRGRVLLTPDVLVRHYEGRLPQHVVGLHSTATDNSCRWVAADLDYHGAGGSSPEANRRAAIGWYGKLTGLGFRPLLTASNGTGGYHLRVIFNTPVPSAIAYHLATWLTADYRDYGLTARPEAYPKQPRLEAGRYGNWLRLPGRHHTRDYWSKVWDGSRGLLWRDATDFILSLPGDDPTLIPAGIEPPPSPLEPQCRSVFHGIVTNGANLEARIRGYMAKLPHLGEGQGRDGVAYNFAAFLTHDLNLTDEQALPWVKDWDKGNTPPKGEGRLREVIANARRYATNACGSGLGAGTEPRAYRVRGGRLYVETGVTL
jgi:hypothetical protein